MSTPSINYKRHRFPPQIIAHAVWLYCRFNMSLREIEELLLERGIDVSYETIRRWVAKFGPAIARGLHHRQHQPSDIWHLDEVVVTIKGRKFWLWRAVDQNGLVLDEILQCRRNTRAAKREIAPAVAHRSHKGLNNRAENSHLPFRKRERAMQGYRPPGNLQRFVSIHSTIQNCFSVPARRRSTMTIRYHKLEAFDAWKAAVAAV
nr:IS6 family transposase [uncultured Roseovarius sp.]